MTVENLTFRTPVFQLAGKTAAERVVYAPLRRLAFTVNETGGRAIDAILGRQLDGNVPEQFLEQLEKMGLFEELPDAPAPVSETGDYTPTSVTLFLTGQCNLHCIYCYAHGGETAAEMPWETALAALDFVIDNAIVTGQRKVQVIFHGGGEPTLGWPVMERAITYTEERCAREGVSCSFESGLNGILPESRVRWLAAKLSNITISVDGPPDIQDVQRPLASAGRPSSLLVERTLAVLDDAKANYGIRCTVTALSVGRIPEVVEYLCGVSRSQLLMIEPAFGAGRALKSGEPPLDPAAFVTGFLRGRLIAKGFGRRLLFSGARADQITNRFCGAINGAFNLTQDGRITSCYEVFSRKDDRISLFEIGGYDDSDHKFWVDQARIAAAARWTASEKPACQACFAKYHCAGDCPAKLAVEGDPGTAVDPARCYVIREITRAQIFSLHGLGDVAWPSEQWRPRPRAAARQLVPIQLPPAAALGG
jgi:uncharacterized protein